MSYTKIRPEEDTKALTILDYITGYIAIPILLIIGFRYLDTWGRTNILEGFLAFSIIAIEIIKNNDLGLGKRYKPLDPYTIPRFLGIWISIELIQFIILQGLFLTIENIEFGLSVIFSAVAEEIFFRGVLISVFKRLDNLLALQSESYVQFKIGKVKFGIMGILGLFSTSAFFAGIHTNYYGDNTLMLCVFFCGLALGFFYYIWDDLLANILGHFALNLRVVGVSYWGWVKL